VTGTPRHSGPAGGTYRKDKVPQFFGEVMDVCGGTLRVKIADDD
jgi:hypothetical protein